MKQRENNLRLISGLVSVLSITGSPMCVASPQNGKLEEVLVTARKRVESMQETPVAVTALNQEALRDANIRNLADLTKIVPGLNTRAGDKSAPFSIRGVGSRGNQNVARDPAVGVYLDGIFVPRTDSQLIEVMSIESVQVLRGPQGTLFGKNTAGGALILTTKKPQEDFSGQLGVDLGNYDRQDINGSVNVPVTGDLLLRFTADSRNRDGYMDDEYTGIDYGNVDTWALAAQARWMPSENLTLDMLAFVSEQDENAAPQTCKLARVGTNLQAFTVPGDSRTYPQACLESTELNEDDKVSMDSRGVPWKMNSVVLGLTTDWDVGHGTIRSITGYLAQDNIITARDQDASSVFTLTNVALLLGQYQSNDIEDEQERYFVSQELQYSSAAFDDRLEYTIGLFYSKEDIDDSPQGFPNSEAGLLGIPVGDPLGTLVNVFPPAIVGFRTTSLSDFNNETLAAFAQGIWHFDEKWSLTFGGRYGEEKKKVEQQNIVSQTLSPGLSTREEFDSLLGTVHDLVPGERVKQDDQWRQFTPTVSLSYIAGDNFLEASFLDSLLIYTTYSEGFKAGGFSSFGGELEVFDPEEITNYEIGLKIDAFEDRLRFNAALYYMEYDDMQITVTRAISDLQTDNGTFNAGQAQMTGIEAELNFAPTANWLFQLSANYIDAKYDEFDDVSAAPGPEPESCARTLGAAAPGSDFLLVDRSCEEFAYLPKTTFSWAAQYNLESDWGSFAALINGSYRDEIYIGLEAGADAADESILDDFTVWNARFSWRPEGDWDIDIALYIDNFTDEEYFGTGNLQLRNQGTASLVRGLPRTYGIQANYWF